MFNTRMVPREGGPDSQGDEKQWPPFCLSTQQHAHGDGEDGAAFHVQRGVRSRGG